GRLEVYRNGRWGTVCDDSFDTKDARVACRHLGWNFEEATVIASSHVPDGSGPTWLDDMKCNGTEKTLFECSHGGWGVENCGHHEDVGVSCHGGIRLIGGVTSGRLEVYRNGRWGTVCDDSFDTKDAQVACRHLGIC
ncbi:unnamed protein product, partial [Owenia fusiformis]